MSKEEFIEFMNDFIYRVNDDVIRDELYSALILFRSGRPSKSDREKLNRIEELEKELIQAKSDLAYNWPRKSEIKTPQKSVEEILQEMPITNAVRDNY